MTYRLFAAAALALVLAGGAAPADAATSSASSGSSAVVAGDDLPLLKQTWECGHLRDGRRTRAWIRRFAFTSGTGAELVGYQVVRGRPHGLRVSKSGPLALRCALRPTWQQLGLAPTG